MYRGRPRRRGMQSNTKNNGKCPSAAEYVGNIVVLGLATLVGELIDLQAANALNVLLDPFLTEDDTTQETEILANTVQDTDIVDLLNGLI